MEQFWMATPDGQTTTYVSPAYEKVWGRSPAELFADPTAWLEGSHPEDRSRVLATLEQYKKKEAEVEYRVIRPDGSVRWLWDHRYPVSDLQGQLTSVVGFAMDKANGRRPARERCSLQQIGFFQHPGDHRRGSGREGSRGE